MKVTLLSLSAAALLATACSTPSYTDTSSTTTATSTSTNPAYSTPATLQTSFTTQYPNASNVNWGAYDAATVPIDWELSGWSALDASDHVVSFDMDNQRYYAWYDADGTWIGSTYAVNDVSKLPEAVQNLIKEKYSGYSIDKVHQEIWKDKMAYEIKLKKEDSKIKLLVDNQGNVLKEKLKD